VRLNLTSEKAVEAATEDILKRAHTARPTARLVGVTVHPMFVRPKARELIVGLADDPTFGPVVVFGSGGTAVEVTDDKALELPPLDLKLAGDLIDRTRVSRLLQRLSPIYAVAAEARISLGGCPETAQAASGM
jgi:acetyltransferase